MVSTNSAAPISRVELLEEILEIVRPLLKHLDEPLGRDFRGIILIPIRKGSSEYGIVLTRDGKLYSIRSDTKNPWREAEEVPPSNFRYENVFEDIYRSLISVLLAKAGQKMDHAVAIQERLSQIQALVRGYASMDLQAGLLVPRSQSIQDVSFELNRVRFSDGREETRLTAKLSVLCPLRRSGCKGFDLLEGVIVAVDSVLSDRVMRFTPNFLNGNALRSSMPFYCNALDCSCAFGLSALNIAEVVEEAKNFLRSKGYGFEPALFEPA